MFEYKYDWQFAGPHSFPPLGWGRISWSPTRGFVMGPGVFKDPQQKESNIETVSAHADCYELFFRRHDPEVENLLYAASIAASWRQPWNHSQSLYLRPEERIMKIGMKRLEKELGFPGLAKIPDELKLIIWGHCKDALIWRYASAVRFTRWVTSLKRRLGNDDYLTGSRLCHIKSWRRGEPPALFNVPKPSPLDDFFPMRQWNQQQDDKVFHMSIDSRGPRSIKWLEKWPKSNLKSLGDRKAHFLAYGRDLQYHWFAYKVSTSML